MNERFGSAKVKVGSINHEVECAMQGNETIDAARGV
jgi:hypothetical protein